jgi:hypothetical protein
MAPLLRLVARGLRAVARRSSVEHAEFARALDERRRNLLERVASDATVKADEVADWEAMARLVERSAPRLPVLASVLPFLCVAFLVTLAGLMRVDRAAFDLDVTATFVQVIVRGPQPLEVPPSSWVMASSKSLATQSYECPISGRIASLRVEPEGGGVRVEVSDLLLGDQLELSSHPDSEKPTYEIALSAANRPDPFQAEVVAKGTAVSFGWESGIGHCGSVPARISLGSQQDLRLTFPLPNDAQRGKIASDVPITAIDLDESVEVGTLHEDTSYRSSQVVSGMLLVSTAGEQRIALRANDRVFLGKLDGARLVSAEVDHGSIHARFVGRAGELAVGDDHRDLRPTHFELWNANRPLKLYWGAATYLFGVALAALRMLKRKSL